MKHLPTTRNEFILVLQSFEIFVFKLENPFTHLDIELPVTTRVWRVTVFSIITLKKPFFLNVEFRIEKQIVHGFKKKNTFW